MADETKARIITSVIGLVLAFFGLILSVNGFPAFHTNPMGLGLKIAIFITGMVMAYVSVMPTPAKYQTQQVKQEMPVQQVQPVQQKAKVSDILLGIAMVFMAIFFIFLSQSTNTIILSLIIAAIGIWLIIASMPEKKKI